MRKILLLMMVMGVIAAHAEDYTYLTFETTYGAKTSVDVSSLPVTIDATSSTLTIGNQSFTLSDLSKMYFSTIDESYTPEKSDNGLAFSSTTATAKMGESFTAPSLSNPNQLTLTWSSSDESVATVDQSGNVTLVAAGTTIIAAAFAGSDRYLAGEVSYTLTVEEAMTSISELNASSDGYTAIYTVSGTYVGRFNSLEEAKTSLRNGVYIVKAAGKTFKMMITK